MSRSKIVNNHLFNEINEIHIRRTKEFWDTILNNSADLNFETSPANYGIFTQEVIEKYTETIPFEEVIENKQLQ